MVCQRYACEFCLTSAIQGVKTLQDSTNAESRYPSCKVTSGKWNCAWKVMRKHKLRWMLRSGRWIINALGLSDSVQRAYRRKIQTLEARLSQMRRKTEFLRHPLEQEITSVAAERETLTKTNQKLRDENQKLRNETEELKAVIEVHLEGVKE